jgi:hypothetical protein
MGMTTLYACPIPPTAVVKQSKVLLKRRAKMTD